MSVCRSGRNKTLHVVKNATRVASSLFRAGEIMGRMGRSAAEKCKNAVCTDNMDSFLLRSSRVVKDCAIKEGARNNFVFLAKDGRGAIVGQYGLVSKNGVIATSGNCGGDTNAVGGRGVCVSDNCLCVAGILGTAAKMKGGVSYGNNAMSIRDSAVIGTTTCNMCLAGKALDVGGSVL